MKIVKLPFESNGIQKELNATLRPASRNVRKELREHSDAFQVKADALDSNYPDIAQLRELPHEEQINQLATDKELYRLNEDLKQKTAALTEQYQVEAFQIVVDRNFLNNDDKRLVASPWDSEFYASVDMNVLRQMVSSFR